MTNFNKDWMNGLGNNNVLDDPAPRPEDYPEKRVRYVPPSYGFYDLMESWNSHMNEAAIRPDELPENVYVAVQQPPGAMMIVLVNKWGTAYDNKNGDPIYGQMWLSRERECGGYMIQWVKASKGFGPLLYDIALELAAENDTWIMSDRNVVSPEAAKVWEYYDQNRKDVEKEPIGLDQDCSFRAAIKAVKYEMADAEQRGIPAKYTDWEQHPLSFKWRKPQKDILPFLKANGKFKTSFVNEEMTQKFDKKYKQVYFELPLSEDTFLHFTTAKRAQEILKEGKLLMSPPYEKFGTDTVDGISLTYGQFVPGVQVTHIPEDEGQIVAVEFKTNTLPDIGFVEEVKWHSDVELINPKVITLQKAKKLLSQTPENKRLNKFDWGWVRYSNE